MARTGPAGIGLGTLDMRMAAIYQGIAARIPLGADTACSEEPCTEGCIEDGRPWRRKRPRNRRRPGHMAKRSATTSGAAGRQQARIYRVPVPNEAAQSPNATGYARLSNGRLQVAAGCISPAVVCRCRKPSPMVGTANRYTMDRPLQPRRRSIRDASVLYATLCNDHCPRPTPIRAATRAEAGRIAWCSHKSVLRFHHFGKRRTP